jgi:plasmid stabilization system protein ParE
LRKLRKACSKPNRARSLITIKLKSLLRNGQTVWTDLAIEDLRSIFDYISRDSKVYGDRYVEKLMSRVDQLESNPKSSRVVPEFNNEEIRTLIEGSTESSTRRREI